MTNEFVTNEFENNVITTWGDSGRAWLQSLPHTVAILAEHWNLTKLTPVTNLTYNYVLTGHQGTTPVILKIGPDAQDIRKEQTALTAYAGIGCIRLLDSNPTYNALLLEQANPQMSLVSLFPDHDDTAVAHAAGIMKQLHKAPLPVNSCLQTLAEWTKDLHTPQPLINPYHLHKAQDLLRHLLATQTYSVLLHGDLHHDNILLSERGWLAIDPKGLIGDPAYEVYAFIRNPYPKILKPSATLVRRLELFSEYLAIDIQRLHGWVYVRAVVEGCWAIKEEKIDPTQALAEAKQIDALPIDRL